MVADVEGSEYRVDDLDYASREEDEEDIRYSLVTVGPELGLHMMRFFHISFRGGISLARRFDAVDDQGNHRARDFRNGFFVQMRMNVGRRSLPGMRTALFAHLPNPQ